MRDAGRRRSHAAQHLEFGVGVDPAAGQEAHAVGRFEGEAGPAARDNIDEQVCVLPILELLSADVERLVADLA